MSESSCASGLTRVCATCGQQQPGHVRGTSKDFWWCPRYVHYRKVCRLCKIENTKTLGLLKEEQVFVVASFLAASSNGERDRAVYHPARSFL